MQPGSEQDGCPEEDVSTPHAVMQVLSLCARGGAIPAGWHALYVNRSVFVAHAGDGQADAEADVSQDEDARADTISPAAARTSGFGL